MTAAVSCALAARLPAVAININARTSRCVPSHKLGASDGNAIGSFAAAAPHTQNTAQRDQVIQELVT